MKSKEILKKRSIKVPEVGLEPTRPKGHMALNHACLPIPASGRMNLKSLRKNPLRYFIKVMR